MSIEEYERLFKAGVNSVYVYQETYRQEVYKHYHPKGMKSNYLHRLETPERLAKAGAHRNRFWCFNWTGGLENRNGLYGYAPKVYDQEILEE